METAGRREASQLTTHHLHAALTKLEILYNATEKLSTVFYRQSEM